MASRAGGLQAELESVGSARPRVGNEGGRHPGERPVPTSGATMSLGFALLLSTAASVAPGCSWDRPDADPYRGSLTAALADFERCRPSFRRP